MDSLFSIDCTLGYPWQPFDEESEIVRASEGLISDFERVPGIDQPRWYDQVR